MIIEIDCPHTIPGKRECNGCLITAIYDSDTRFCETGKIVGNVFRVAGSYDVYGVLKFTAFEDYGALCRCNLSDEEWDEARDTMIELACPPNC